jgi:hypothetical protein
VQSLPEGGIRLVDVVKNISDGSSIRQSDYAMFDMLGSDWRGSAPGLAENFFYDERNPKEFEVYPPQVGGERIEVVYNAQPGNASVTGDIIIDDMYADSLIDYIAYRGFSKDTEDSAAELNRATAFYRAFLHGAGLKDITDAAIEPRRS